MGGFRERVSLAELREMNLKIVQYATQLQDDAVNLMTRLSTRGRIYKWLTHLR